MNAHSGDTAWVAASPATQVSRTASFAVAEHVPEAQPTFLAFRHWHLLDFGAWGDRLHYWDGGTVEVDDPFDEAGPIDLSGEPWINGPTATLESPNAGRKAFSGSSRGWAGSVVDLSAFAGREVQPSFTMRTDSSVGMVGWYLDDIQVYTCDPQLTALTDPALSGTAKVGGVLRSTAGTWSQTSATGLALRFQWLRNGVVIPDAERGYYVVSPKDVGKRLTARVLATYRSQRVVRTTAPSAVVPRCQVDVMRHAIDGTGRVGRRLRSGDLVARPAGVTYRFQWLRDGRAIRGATARSYLLVRADRGHNVRLLVRGVLSGCSTGLEYSVNSIRVR